MQTIDNQQQEEVIDPDIVDDSHEPGEPSELGQLDDPPEVNDNDQSSTEPQTHHSIIKDQQQEEVSDSDIVEDSHEPEESSEVGQLDDHIEASDDDENSTELQAHQPKQTNPGDGLVKSSISDLPITVSVHVGTFSMPLEQIENLKANDLIMVQPFYQNKVSLRVGESEIGVGKIVSVNGDVAIQIIRLWS